MRTTPAVAVDISALMVTRRHAQTVVDIGALAGSQFAGRDSDPSAAQLAVITEIKSITATNLELTAAESDAAESIGIAMLDAFEIDLVNAPARAEFVLEVYELIM